MYHTLFLSVKSINRRLILRDETKTIQREPSGLANVPGQDFVVWLDRETGLGRGGGYIVHLQNGPSGHQATC